MPLAARQNSTALSTLRERLARFAPAPVAPGFPCPALEDGLPLGALSEIVSPTGAGKVSFVLRFLAQHPHLKAAWIEKQHSLYPPALVQAGLTLERFWFFEAGAQSAWTALEVLRSHIFPVVVLDELPAWSTAGLRRLQLAAEEAKACVLLLNASPQQEARWALARHVHLR